MGKVKEVAYNDPVGVYDYYMEKRLEGLPLEAIPEVQSYMNRHRIEYLFFLDIMEPTRFAEELMNDERCKRDFLMYKIHQDIDNSNIGLMLNDIYDYIDEHIEELETNDYLEWRYRKTL